MDMGFLRRAERIPGLDRPVRIDHALLLAAIAAGNGVAAAARVRTSHGCGGEEALVELLVGGPAWRRALTAQRGCFSRAEAERRLNGP